MLINDTYRHVTPNIEIRSQPRCGTLSVDGQSVEYDGLGTCAGNVTFAYCIEGVDPCEEAVVSLNVRPGRAAESPKVAVTTEPAVPEAPPQPDAEKPTETALVAVAEPPRIPVPTASLPAAALISELRDFMTDTAALTYEGPAELDLTYRVVARGGAAPDPALASLFTGTSQMVRINPYHDQAVDPPLKPIALDNGTAHAMLNGCRIGLTGQTLSGAEIDLRISAQCFPLRVAKVVQEGFAFVMRLDHEGTGSLVLPAMDVNSELSIYFDGHQVPVIVGIRVPELKNLARTIVTIDRASALNLAAREYSAQDGSRLVQVDTSLDVIETLAEQRGYVKAYVGDMGQNIFAYTHPLQGADADKTIELTLRGPSDKACGHSTKIAVLDTHVGDLTVHTTQRDLPDCKFGAVYENPLKPVVLTQK